VAGTVANAIRKELGATLDATGLNELSQTLREDAQGFFDPVLGPVLDPLVKNTLYPQLAAMLQTKYPGGVFEQRLPNHHFAGRAIAELYRHH
jgi:hypothetical protein